MNRHDWAGVLLAVALLVGCADTPITESARLDHQDSSRAVKIKTLLLEEADLAGAAIDVDIRNDIIVLEGFVETGDQRRRAEAIAREHGPGSEVENRITVR